MNENHMKTSVTTGEVSLRWAKKADQRAKSSENGPISPNCYLLGLRRRLDYGPRRQKYHENAGNNHLKTVNIRSNGESRLIRVQVRTDKCFQVLGAWAVYWNQKIEKNASNQGTR